MQLRCKRKMKTRTLSLSLSLFPSPSLSLFPSPSLPSPSYFLFNLYVWFFSLSFCVFCHSFFLSSTFIIFLFSLFYLYLSLSLFYSITRSLPLFLSFLSCRPEDNISYMHTPPVHFLIGIQLSPTFIEDGPNTSISWHVSQMK